MIRDLSRCCLWPGIALALSAVVLWCLSPGCASRTSPPAGSSLRPVSPGVERRTAGGPSQGPTLAQVAAEPMIRVRIAQGAREAAVGGAGPVAVGPLTGLSRVEPRTFSGPLRIRHTAEGFFITDARGQTVRWALPDLWIRADGPTLRFGNALYPGSLALHPDGKGGVDAVNHVPLEAYLPGVLDRELYASWHIEAFKAQAVAARSYALWERTLNAQRHYDLESTTASQAYSGAVTNRKALDAVRATRGQVVAYGGRVVPAFYSSSSGGAGQDAALAWPGRVVDIPPLRGRGHGSWGSQSSRYRWGPIVRPRDTLSRRIAAWGRSQRHAVAGLGTLRSIEIASRSRTGRPASFVLTDTAGRRFRLPPEEFRFACNHAAPGLPELSGAQRLSSSHVTPRVVGDTVQFVDGRGFGHGVGLDQWGAQAMAAGGYSHASILAFYYPQSTIERAY